MLSLANMLNANMLTVDSSGDLSFRPDVTAERLSGLVTLGGPSDGLVIAGQRG